MYVSVSYGYIVYKLIYYVMKNFGIKLLLVAFAVVLVQGCGESEEERRAREQARMDSLRQVQQQQIAEQMRARQDSLEQANASGDTPGSTSGSESGASTGSYSFEEDGAYAVQVGAFRSEEKANSFIAKWSDRNYPNAYVVKVGDEEWGDVWFRVRVGYFGTKEAAASLGKELAEEINSEYWVSKVR